MTYTLRTAVAVTALAVALMVSPVLAGETQDSGDVNVTIEKRIKFNFQGSNKFTAGISNTDFKKGDEKIWNSMGAFSYDINTPWELSVRRTAWAGPKGWDPTQDSKLKFLIKTDDGYGSAGWFHVPVDPAADWFGSIDDFGANKTGRINYKVNWADLPVNKRVNGSYTTTISFTLHEHDG